MSGSFNILLGGQLQPSTTTMYNMMCKKHHKKVNTVDLGDGARGHWIGDPNAKWIMLYAPGGAFIMPGTFAHFEFMFHCRQRAKRRFHDFAVFCLDYSLVPEFVYPTQLRQMVSGLRYLLHAQMRDPDTVSIFFVFFDCNILMSSDPHWWRFSWWKLSCSTHVTPRTSTSINPTA